MILLPALTAGNTGVDHTELVAAAPSGKELVDYAYPDQPEHRHQITQLQFIVKKTASVPTSDGSFWNLLLDIDHETIGSLRHVYELQSVNPDVFDDMVEDDFTPPRLTPSAISKPFNVDLLDGGKGKFPEAKWDDE